MFDQISVLDWIMLALSILSLISAYLRGLNRLHPEARKWLSEIGEPLIRSIIDQCGEMAELSGEQKRQRAAEMLKGIVHDSVGIAIPASMANYLIEHVYQSIKERGSR